MGHKPPVISISKLMELVKCPRCAWFAFHRNIDLSAEYAGGKTRDKYIFRARYDKARKKQAGIPRRILGWPTVKGFLKSAFLVGQDTAERFRYRLKYFDARNGFIIRGQIDDGLFLPPRVAYIPVRIAFPSGEDQEISRLKQARLDESVRLLKECGFRIMDRMLVVEYFSAPGSMGPLPGWECRIRMLRTSLRRSNRLHRTMKKIINLKNPPRASKECNRHKFIAEEMCLLRQRKH
jgi:hypothetical protein